MNLINYDKKYLKEVAELFTNTIHKTCRKDYSKEQLNTWANPHIDYDSWEKRLEKTKPFLVLKNDILLGFAEFYDDYIDCFYVHYKYQGVGVGKILMEHILKEAFENQIKTLRVDVSITAKSFFEKYGFIEFSKNEIKRDNQILINYSLELSIKR